ncbi:hypothetical protein DENSPDRAFT_262406 [Dentipellis sp. KUC8613]|nr:hypothetical protein DENSPDRAFT_262406 [Dentipellis sp. KUC8613]
MGLQVAGRDMKDKTQQVFVDLIHETSNCFGNWSPNRSIRVGDYGVLNRETGEFEKEGSIYDEQFMPNLAIKRNYPVFEGATEGQYIVVSRGCTAQGFDPAFTAYVDPSLRATIHSTLDSEHPEIVGSTIKGRWKITGKRGAILVLHKPKEFRLSNKGKLYPHLSVFLQRRVLVTSVFTCPMFFLYVANKPTINNNVALGLSVPDGSEDGTKGIWHHQATGGVWKSGGETGDSTYYPLYTLYTPKPRSVWDRVVSRR